jgi:hypothetical protein
MESKLTIIRLVIISIFLVLIVAAINYNYNKRFFKYSLTKTVTLSDSLRTKYAANYVRGKHVFQRFCITCHEPPEKKVWDNYTFDKIFERYPYKDKDYFLRFIMDSKQLRVSGDEYAKEVHKQYNSNYDHHFRDSLAHQELIDLIVYLNFAAMQKLIPN